MRTAATAGTTTAVVPLRDGRSGKTRLAPWLQPEERSQLIAVLARHVVGTLLAAEGVVRVLVVTADPDVVAAALGSPDPRVVPVAQPADRSGLNAAVTFGRELAWSTRPADRLLVMHADLPALTVRDVAALLAQDAPVVLAADRVGRGTNAVLLSRRAAALPFRFGEDSLTAHRAEADRLGLEVSVVRREGTGVDLDTEADVEALPASVRAWLRREVPAADRLLPR